MAEGNNTSGCLIVLAIVVGLVFWPITLVLICLVVIVSIAGHFIAQAYVIEANEWEKSHRMRPCVFLGHYGFVEGVKVEQNKIAFSVKPIGALLPDSSEDSKVFTAKIKDGSFKNTMRHLFKLNSISMLEGVSVELSAIESALKCQEQFAWCVEAMNSLVKLSDQINRALSLAPGNPLLEPSIPSMETAKAQIANESLCIAEAKEFSLDTLKDLIDYLSVPEELRQPSAISNLDNIISVRNHDLRSSFNELLEFNREYVKLID